MKQDFFVYPLGSLLDSAVPSHVCTVLVSSACQTCKGTMTCFRAPAFPLMPEAGKACVGVIGCLRAKTKPSFVNQKVGGIVTKFTEGDGTQYTGTGSACFPPCRSLGGLTLSVIQRPWHHTQSHSFFASSLDVLRAAELRSGTVGAKEINGSMTFSRKFSYRDGDTLRCSLFCCR